LELLDLKNALFMEDMVAFEGGPYGSGGFVIVVLADGTHFFIRYFVDFACIAA
jgi:hypothetical protein